MKYYGITQQEKAEEDGELKPLECPRCKRKNPAGSKFCGGCSMVLDDRVAVEINKRMPHAERVQELLNRWLIEHAPRLLEQALKDPEIRRELKLATEGGGVES